MYFDVLRRVKMDRWSKGRVMLTGDAAWCATPIAGVGTALAIVGAFVLADEMAGTTDLAKALDRYEKAVRPFVEKGQGVLKIAPKMLQPQTASESPCSMPFSGSCHGIKPLAARAAFAASADDIDLPEYEALPLFGQRR